MKKEEMNKLDYIVKENKNLKKKIAEINEKHK